MSAVSEPDNCDLTFSQLLIRLDRQTAAMTVIASPPPQFSQRKTNGDFSGPSNLHNGQFLARPTRPPAESTPSAYSLANVHSDRGIARGKPRLANGHAAGDGALNGVNHNLSPEQQELIRSHTENQKLAHRPRAQLTRTQTDFGANHQAKPTRAGAAEDIGELRHGWEDQYNSSEFLGLLSSVSFRISAAMVRSSFHITYFSTTLRLSTCISRTNVTRLGESPRKTHKSSHQRNGETRTVRRRFQRLWCYV